MIIFEWLLAILLGAVPLAVLANRMAVPYPALLALGGAVLAFIPGAPRIVLESDLALALFVAPVLRMRAMTPRPAISETTGCR
jgi:CPA1 family monovalent cation:H+ antiporter